MSTPRLPTQSELDAIAEMAHVFAMLEPGPPDEYGKRHAIVKAKMLNGYFAGLAPTQALAAYEAAPFGGAKAAPTISPKADEKLRLIRAHPLFDWQLIDLTNAQCVIRIFRLKSKDGEWTHDDCVFTMTMAEERNMTQALVDEWANGKKTGKKVWKRKDTWTRHPDMMLRAKCINRAVRLHCPEVLQFSADADDASDEDYEPAAAFADAPETTAPAASEPAAMAPVVDIKTGEVVEEKAWVPDEVRPATASVATPSTTGYDAIIANLSDPKFSLVTQAIDGYIRSIVDATGKPAPGELWLEQFRRKSHDDQKLALLELAGQAPAEAPATQSDDNYTRLMAKLRTEGFAMPSAGVDQAVAAIALHHGQDMPGNGYMATLRGLTPAQLNEALISYDRDGAKKEG